VDLGKVAFLVGGGGFAGANSVGFLKALLAKGIRPDFIQAVSVGVLTSAKLIECDFNIKQLEEIWMNIQKIGPASVFDKKEIPLNIARGSSSLFSNKKVYESLVKRINFNAIVNSPIEYQLVTTNATYGCKVVFSNKDEAVQNDPSLLEKATLAAVGLFGFLPPVFINNEWYYDGMTFRLGEAIKRGCDTIFILSNTPLENDKQKNFNFGELKWYRSTLFGFQAAVTDLAVTEIEYSVHEGYNLIENNPSELLKHLQNKPARFRRRLRKILNDAVEVVTSENPQRVLIPHRIVLLTPTDPIPTLHTMDFRMADERTKYPGDIAAAIDQCSQISDFLDKL